MFVIKTKRDIDTMKFQDTVPPWLRAVVENEFTALHQTLAPELELDKFSLELHGPLAILGQGESDLSPIGISYALTESWPEFIEKVIIERESVYYRIGLFLDNDYMLLIYGFADDLTEDVKEWLDDLADIVEEG